MQDRHLFEYAVIRVVPRVEREEFLNVGVILLCSKQKYLKMMYHVDRERLQALSYDLDIEALEENLLSFQRIAEGGKDSGPIGELDAASRFRWLTATRSTVVQTSKVHPGFCLDGDDSLTRLYEQLVK
ncbi:MULTISPECIES: DUF3037 domain-containing protein [unclassified Mucilaginibacter]|uniref:DUF3037 domain-containing protein n=1 Tax=unclassified Mucilaginibacter TaxID=2617802 RepID=UPI002AC9BAD5|nr:MULTISPECIES: DUF3037 domain-containing protein [unclassified Mucilaginibacter]MEB0261729.1 DUF3037 domain-containing protein [Mucilaginibacter sp. 10I4]MEB0277601.1 DUF3037 domain-containing protein [Mucilaginibacter sp. 10B2]MEB0299516.1 DUF3037 domain-containing protein [Mucilaginibacter sp. 5C4]WPX24770.1 DUF3037 domain-containing protein [Mucilaginibacter sp. 5C4]